MEITQRRPTRKPNENEKKRGRWRWWQKCLHNCWQFVALSFGSRYACTTRSRFPPPFFGWFRPPSNDQRLGHILQHLSKKNTPRSCHVFPVQFVNCHIGFGSTSQGSYYETEKRSSQSTKHGDEDSVADSCSNEFVVINLQHDFHSGL